MFQSDASAEAGAATDCVSVRLIQHKNDHKTGSLSWKLDKSQLTGLKKEKIPMYQKTSYGFLNKCIFETAYWLPSWWKKSCEHQVGSDFLNTSSACLTAASEHAVTPDGIIGASLMRI